MATPDIPVIPALRPAWNRGRIAGPKRPLKPKRVWAIRGGPELAEVHCGPALFPLAIDSKPCGCDLVKMKGVDRSDAALARRQASQSCIAALLTGEAPQSKARCLTRPLPDPPDA